MKPTPFTVTRTGKEILVTADGELLDNLISVLNLLVDLTRHVKLHEHQVEIQRRRLEDPVVLAEAAAQRARYTAECRGILRDYERQLARLGDRKAALKAVCAARGESQFAVNCALATARQERRRKVVAMRPPAPALPLSLGELTPQTAEQKRARR